ncbi:hypothetical protein BKA81DRAFT_381033 [Phyllosticta paracitricarpa]
MEQNEDEPPRLLWFRNDAEILGGRGCIFLRRIPIKEELSMRAMVMKDEKEVVGHAANVVMKRKTKKWYGSTEAILCNPRFPHPHHPQLQRRLQKSAVVPTFIAWIMFQSKFCKGAWSWAPLRARLMSLSLRLQSPTWKSRLSDTTPPPMILKALIGIQTFAVD